MGLGLGLGLGSGSGSGLGSPVHLSGVGAERDVGGEVDRFEVVECRGATVDMALMIKVRVRGQGWGWA